jgi:hypothetical protein
MIAAAVALFRLAEKRRRGCSDLGAHRGLRGKGRLIHQGIILTPYPFPDGFSGSIPDGVFRDGVMERR